MNDTKSIIGSSVATVLTAMGMTSTNEVLEMVSLILTILGALLNFVIIPFIKWLKKAKSDGKITTEEVEEGLNTIAKGCEEVKDIVEQNKKEEK